MFSSYSRIACLRPPICFMIVLNVHCCLFPLDILLNIYIYYYICILYIPLRPGVLLSADLWDITQNRLLKTTDS